MDLQLIRDLLRSVIEEFKAYKTACVVLFVSILAGCAVLAIKWPEQYTANAVIEANRKNLAEDLLRGQAAFQEVPPSSIAEEGLRSRLILSETAIALGMIKPTSPPEATNKAVNQLSRSFETISIGRGRNNNLLRISLSNRDPEFSYYALNTLLETFLKNSSKEKQLESQGTYQFIDQTAQEYKEKLAVAEKKLSDFKSRNTDGSERDVVNRINSLRSQLKTLSIDIDEEQTKIGSIKQKLNEEQEYQQAKTQMATLIGKRNNLQGSLDQLRLTYKDAYPEIISLKSQIEELNSQIDELQKIVPGGYSGDSASEDIALFDELRRQLSEAEVKLQGMLQRRKSIQSLLANEESRAERIAQNLAELSELTRDYDTTKEFYETLISRRESANLSASIDREGQGMTYRISEHPVLPLHPSGVRKVHFILVGPLAGLLIPFALLVAYVFLDPRIRNESELKPQLPEGLELLGSIPTYQHHSPVGVSLKSLKSSSSLLLLVCLAALAGYGYTAYLWILK